MRLLDRPVVLDKDGKSTLLTGTIELLVPRETDEFLCLFITSNIIDFR